jgi:glycosyltransferase involved in cell wall biosynthesis
VPPTFGWIDQKMRIAIDLTALLPEASGVDNYLTQLVLHLGRVDHDNQYKVFVNYEDRNLFTGVLPRNFTVVPFCLRPRPIRLLFQQLALPVAAMRWGADVVHSPSFIKPLFRGKARHVVTVHDMTFFSLPDCHTSLRRSFLYKRAVLDSIRRADLVIVPSCATLRHIARVMPEFSLDCARVIPQGVGDEFHVYPPEEVRESIRRLQLPSSYILYVGTIEPRKNLPRLVESYRRLVANDKIAEHLVLVGRLGWNYEDLFSQLDAPELRGRVHMMGYVSQRDLPWFYAGAKLFIYPSLQEGFGFPPLEAMACGVPTISSNSSSLMENLEGAAELVPPDDVAALTSVMSRLLYDESLQAKYKALGLARAARFRWVETARQTLNCYCALATAKSNGKRKHDSACITSLRVANTKVTNDHDPKEI